MTRTGGRDDLYAHPEDEGLAAERTELAWSRSGLAIMACGAIVLKGLPEVSGVPSRPLVGAGIVALGVLVWGTAWLSSRRRRAVPGRPRPVPLWRDLAPVALGTAVVGAVSFVLAFLDPD